MSRGDGSGWVSAVFAHLDDPDVPVQVRLDSADCLPVRGEPGPVTEHRLAAVHAADQAVRRLRAGDLAAAETALAGALDETRNAIGRLQREDRTREGR